MFRSLCLLAAFPAIESVNTDAGYDCSDPHTISASSVYMSGDADYDDRRMAQYARLSGTHAFASAKLSPGVLVYCSKESHVQNAIKFAGACGYKVTVRSGGHSYTGSSACHTSNCMQLDLTEMTNIYVLGFSIYSDPGLRLSKFAEFTSIFGLSVPHGGCATVGVGGHMQSSAWGMMTHSHGSGLDRVSSFRMVTANGEVAAYSRDDMDNTIYKSVLGSAPGSFGVATQYTFDGVQDLTVPFVRMITISIPYTKDRFLASLKQTQFIVMDQEAKNLRDMKILHVTGPDTEDVHTSDCYIRIYALWTGVDTGIMSSSFKKLYTQPFWDMPHQPFPLSADVPATLAVATRLMVNQWTNHNDRYAVQAFHSDYWWSDEFLDILGDEVDRRVDLMPNVYPSFQFLPLGSNSQWARNAGMNSLTWRDTRAYIDDWVFVKNEDDYKKVSQDMHDFRERTKKYWVNSDGQERQTYMSPMTTYVNSTDLSNPSIRKQFFADDEQYRALQAVKAQLDPTAMFNNMGTIQLPSKDDLVV